MPSSKNQLKKLNDEELVNWWKQIVEANTNKATMKELVAFIVEANPGMPNDEAERAIVKGRRMVVEEFQKRNIPLPS